MSQDEKNGGKNMEVKGWVEFEAEEDIDTGELEDKIYDLLWKEYHNEIPELPSVNFWRRKNE